MRITAITTHMRRARNVANAEWFIRTRLTNNGERPFDVANVHWPIRTRLTNNGERHRRDGAAVFSMWREDGTE